jgi:tRNA(Ile)-lysidine synthase
MNFPVTSPAAAVQTFIRQLRKPAKILVMVSGGSDSLGLLLALIKAAHASANDDVALSAVTIDHQLRPEAAEEARQVGEICRSFGVKHVIRRWDEVKPKSGISQASRLARYRLVAAVAEELGTTVIVTGHTLDDQLETVLMRAARSTRTENTGLSGMAERTLYAGRHWLVRPFLSVRRADIREFLGREQLGWVDDPSNEDRKYERVRTRQGLEHLSEASVDLSAGEKRKAISNAAACLLKDHAQGDGSGVIWLDNEAFDQKPDVWRHALAAVAAVIGGRQHLPAADSMDRLSAFILQNRLGRMTLSRTVFDRRRDGLYLYRENRNLPSLPIVPGETVLWDDRFMLHNPSAEPISVSANGRKNTELASVIFPSVPVGVAKRAFSCMPDIFDAGGKAILTRSVLMPYELFLPDFDLELAGKIANLLDCAPVLQPPV